MIKSKIVIWGSLYFVNYELMKNTVENYIENSGYSRNETALIVCPAIRGAFHMGYDLAQKENYMNEEIYPRLDLYGRLKNMVADAAEKSKKAEKSVILFFKDNKFDVYSSAILDYSKDIGINTIIINVD